MPGAALVALTRARATARNIFVPFALALFILIATWWYPVDLPVVLIGAVALGFCARSIARDDTYINFSRRRAMAAAFGSVFLALGLLFMFVGVRQMLGAFYDIRGRSALNAGDSERAVTLLSKAALFWRTPQHQYETSFTLAQIVLSDLSSGEPIDTERMRERLDTVITFANLARDHDPGNIDIQLYRASLFTSLIRYGYPDAAEHAGADLAEAVRYSPNRPDIFYQRALLDLAEGNVDAAQADIRAALALKPDYEDAAALLKELSLRL